MDTTKLVDGQEVYMLKPPYPFWFCIDEGKVVKVTPRAWTCKLLTGKPLMQLTAKRKDRGDNLTFGVFIPQLFVVLGIVGLFDAFWGQHTRVVPSC